jgi:hypothetical protein
LTDQLDHIIETFADQLDSSELDVLVSAGSSIALCFELARMHEDENEENLGLQHRQYQVLTQIKGISHRPAKSTAKKNKRRLRPFCDSLVTSLERRKGPGYSTAHRMDTSDCSQEERFGGPPPAVDEIDESLEYGYRHKIQIGKDIIRTVDSWALLAKLNMLKGYLRDGLSVHLKKNLVVRETLEISTSDN